MGGGGLARLDKPRKKTVFLNDASPKRGRSKYTPAADHGENTFIQFELDSFEMRIALNPIVTTIDNYSTPALLLMLLLTNLLCLILPKNIQIAAGMCLLQELYTIRVSFD